MELDDSRLFEQVIKQEKNTLKVLLKVTRLFQSSPTGDISIDDLRKNLRKFVMKEYVRAPSRYTKMISDFIKRNQREVEKDEFFDKNLDTKILLMDSGPTFGRPVYWEVDLANQVLAVFEESIDWTQNRPRVPETQEKEKKKTKSNNILKRVLGVLKSYPRISIAELSKYSGESEEVTRDMLFEMIGDNLVSGRFDSTSDEFISAHAAAISKEIKSESPSLARCMYCGKSLGRALISGDEVRCPSCGMVNVG